MKTMWHLIACAIISTNIHSMEMSVTVIPQNNRSILSKILSFFQILDQTKPQQQEIRIQAFQQPHESKENQLPVLREKFKQNPLIIPKNRNKDISQPSEEDDEATTITQYNEPTFHKKIIGKLPPDSIREEVIEAAKNYGKTILYAHFSPLFHTSDTHKNQEYIKLMRIIMEYIDWKDYQTRICLTKSPEQALPPS